MHLFIALALLATCALAQVTEGDPEYDVLHAKFLHAHTHTFYDSDVVDHTLTCKNLSPNKPADRWGCVEHPGTVFHASVGFGCAMYYVDEYLVFGKHCTVNTYYGATLIADGFSDVVPLDTPTEPDEELPEDGEGDVNATATDAEPVDDADSTGSVGEDDVPPSDATDSAPENPPPEDAEPEDTSASEQAPEDVADEESAGIVANEPRRD